MQDGSRREVWDWISATAAVDTALRASKTVTFAVERTAAEHTLILELARPQGWVRLLVADGAAVRRIVGDRDRRSPRRPRDAPRRDAPRRGVLTDRRDVADHRGGTRWVELDDHIDHNPDRDRDLNRAGARRGSVADCWVPREHRPGQPQQHRQAGGWYADRCTD
jgi:hypothetical protein